MATLDDIRKLLDGKNMSLAREMEPDETTSEMSGDVTAGGSSVSQRGDMARIRIKRFVLAKNALGKDIRINGDGDVFPLGQGESLMVEVDITVEGDTDGKMGFIDLDFMGADGVIILGSPFFFLPVSELRIKLTNVRKDMALLRIGDEIGNVGIIPYIPVRVNEKKP